MPKEQKKKLSDGKKSLSEIRRLLERHKGREKRPQPTSTIGRWTTSAVLLSGALSAGG
jgi:hypothetical protein